MNQHQVCSAFIKYPPTDLFLSVAIPLKSGCTGNIVKEDKVKMYEEFRKFTNRFEKYVFQFADFFSHELKLTEYCVWKKKFGFISILNTSLNILHTLTQSIPCQ